MLKLFFISIIPFVAIASPSPQLSVVSSKGDSTEQYERNVDEVALASQEQAILRLSRLIKKYRGTSQEPQLLMKLGELEQQAASIQFRIAHGLSHQNRANLDLSLFNKAMERSIKTLNDLMGRFPNSDEMSQALFMRGKGYEEIGDKTRAAKDYRELIRRFPEVHEAIQANMSLAEFSIESSDHTRAIHYLNEVEKNPNNPYFPFALYKLAWCYYNLKNTEKALSYIERHVAYYNEKKVSSDEALRESALLDATLFYFDGFERDASQYSLAGAIPYFKKLESGENLGKMAHRFSKLLRSHGHEAAMLTFKEVWLNSEFDRPESLEIVMTVYEYYFNKRRFSQVPSLVADIVKIHQKNKNNSTKVQSLLLETADSLQKIILKNKGVEGVYKLSTVLASIYDAFTRIVEERDPRIKVIHYNLAETLFGIQEFGSATLHYRWVVSRGDWKDAGLRSIASRYEELKRKNFIPSEVRAKPISVSDSKFRASLDPLLIEWIDWINVELKNKNESIDRFYFESNRVLYSLGDVLSSVNRMKEFALSHPMSKVAIPSASLVIDTFIASQDWSQVSQLANIFLKLKAWKDSDFHNRLLEVGADAEFKGIEPLFQAQDFRGVLKNVDRFIENYPQSKRVFDSLRLAGAAALKLENKELAKSYFTRLAAPDTPLDTRGLALLTRATLEEEEFDFDDALQDYLDYLALPQNLGKLEENKFEPIKKKALTLAWLSNSQNILPSVLTAKQVCTVGVNNQMDEICDRFHALNILRNDSYNQEFQNTAFKKARFGFSKNKSLWALLALRAVKEMPFRDRHLMVRLFILHFGELDGFIQFSILSEFSTKIPRVFELNRNSLPSVAPLRSDEKYIVRRVEVIHEMENAAEKAVQLPWSGVRAQVLKEMAHVYLETAKSLGELSFSDKIVDKIQKSFEEKGQKILKKSSEMVIAYSGMIEVGSILAIDSKAAQLKEQWSLALQSKHWPRVAFFLQEASEKKQFPSPSLALMRALSLLKAGAKEEAQLEIEKQKILPSDQTLAAQSPTLTLQNQKK